jgi:hypothetical protein
MYLFKAQLRRQAMNEKLWREIEKQLPQGARILRHYHAAENGDLRVIAKAPADQGESRYVVKFEDGCPHVRLMP